MFTPQEKTSAAAYVNGIGHLTKGIAAIAALGETRAHDFRPRFVQTLDNAMDVWEAATGWFAGVSGTVAGDRVAVLSTAHIHHDDVMELVQALITSAASVPEMASAAASFTNASTAFGAFDWSLSYTDPRHQVNPAMPFHADKTTVGPHGDWGISTAILRDTAVGMGKAIRTFIEVYRTVPIYTPLANHPFQEQFSIFAKILNQLARVWSMHIEVEHESDRTAIDLDMAHSPSNRGRGFLRTLRQTELLFTLRASKGPNFWGRQFESGLVDELRTLYFQEFIVPLGRVNGPAWVHSLVVGDGTGGLFRFHAELTDFWQVLDSWVQSAFGFYHPVPDRTKWEPVQPSPPVQAEQDALMASKTIPAGFFDAEDAEIVSAKADVAMASARLSDILASLRAKEGQEVI